MKTSSKEIKKKYCFFLFVNSDMFSYIIAMIIEFNYNYNYYI
jgi:hypothetical protein